MKKSIILAGLLSVSSLFGADFFINDVKVTGNFAETEEEWQYARKIDLTKENFPAEFNIPAKALRRHPTSKHVSGYNGNVIFKVKAPTSVQEFTVTGKISNFPDRVVREAEMSYSLDGVNYTSLGRKKFGGPHGTSIIVGGKVTLPPNSGNIFFKFERFYKKGDRNGQYGNVLWGVFDLNFYGDFKTKALESAVIINKVAPAIGYTATDKSWQFDRVYDLVKDSVSPELGITDKHIRKHPRTKYIKGYNGNIILAVKAPSAVKSIDCSGTIANYPDKKERFASISYSLDGKTYTQVVKKPFGGKSGYKLNLNGKTDLPANDGNIYIKFERHYEQGDRNGQYGYVLWHNFRIKLNGDIVKK